MIKSQTAVHHLCIPEMWRRTWEGGSDLLKADNGSTRTPDLWTPIPVDLREAICANKDFSESPQHASCKIPLVLLTSPSNLNLKVSLSIHSVPSYTFNLVWTPQPPGQRSRFPSSPSLLWNPDNIYILSFALLFLKHLPPTQPSRLWSLFLLKDTLPISSPWSLRCPLLVSLHAQSISHVVLW